MHYYILTILLLLLIAIGVFAWAIFQAGKQRIVEHFIRYSKSYLVGAVFVVVSLLGAFVSEFEHIAKADRLAFDWFDWALHYAGMGVTAGTVILAFLNQTNSKDQAKEPIAAPPIAPPASPASSV